jgi:hypothetical protein
MRLYFAKALKRRVTAAALSYQQQLQNHYCHGKHPNNISILLRSDPPSLEFQVTTAPTFTT